MRRNLAVVFALLMFLVAVAAPAFAQAPAAPAPSPRVTISGFIDSISSWSRNMSVVDINPGRGADKEWYARTRLRPDITAELGTSKFVLALEVDYTMGQIANTDSNIVSSNAAAGGAVTAAGFQRNGANAGGDINTDVAGIIEIKWGYVEFMAPLIPFPTLIRFGLQPFQETYKVGVYATGDFPGLKVVSTITPQLKLHGTYVQIEEESTGPRDAFLRGEDWAFVGGIEVTPFKGLDLRPIYSYISLDSVTSGSTRFGKGGVANAQGAGCAGPFPAAGGCAGKPNFHEGRHTIGMDARWTGGPFTFDPTIFYQFGQRELVAPTNGTIQSQGEAAWFVDLRGGWRAGPLLLEGAAVYTTGNKAGENLRHGRRQINYYQPLDLDTGFFSGYGMNVGALGIDYFNQNNSLAGGLNTGNSIGYDKYGLIRLAGKVTYALTPAFSLLGNITGNWTAEKVDTSEGISVGTGRLTCDGSAGTNAVCGTGRVSDGRGDARYMGTEVDLGFTWRFAPGIAFDMSAGYFFSGPALSAVAILHPQTGAIINGRSPQDVQTVAARVRFSF